MQNIDLELQDQLARVRQEQLEIDYMQKLIDDFESKDQTFERVGACKSYFRSVLPQLTEEAAVVIETARTNVVESKAKVATADWILSAVEPQELAVMFIQALGSISFAKAAVSLTSMSTSLGNSIKTQRDINHFKANSKANHEGGGKTMAEKLIARHGIEDRRKIRKWIAKDEAFVSVSLEATDALQIGATVIDQLFPVIEDKFTISMKRHGSKLIKRVSLRDECAEDVYDDVISELIATAACMPMVCKPNPMTSETVPRRYRYLVPRSHNGVYDAARFQPSPSAMKALNVIQDTPWEINKRVLEVAQAVIDSTELTNTVFGLDATDLTMPKELIVNDWSVLEQEEVRRISAERGKHYQAAATYVGKHQCLAGAVNMANKMKDEDRIYFPHFFDFRGRIYPMGTYLTPQDGDASKALLLFKNKKPLGKTGMYWLCIEIANTCGQDKMTFENRLKWVDEHMDEIRQSVESPLDCGLWAQADEPLMALAAMIELVAAIDSGDPERYETGKPVNVDGVCNGMQILSLMGRDEHGAEATNVKYTDGRRDFYMEVAKPIMGWLHESDDERSVYWLQEFAEGKGRKIVKRGCMTTPYGVTEQGMADQLVNDGHAPDRTHAAFMANMIVKAMSTAAPKAMAIRDWLVECTRVVSKNGATTEWTVPTGSHVTQRCLTNTRKRVMTPCGSLTVKVPGAEDTIDTAANARGIVANVVHSFDAAMLAKTALKLNDEGIVDGCWIHDSYGVHPSNVDTLHRVLREAAVEMFSVNVLEELKLDFEDILDGAVEIPEPPQLGTLDIDAVKLSPYFFS